MSENKLMCYCCKKGFTKDEANIGFGLFSPVDKYPYYVCPYCGEYDIEARGDNSG